MANSISDERRLLGDDFAVVAPSHYPALGDLPAEEVLALARKIGFGIAEVAVEWQDDRRTKINPIRDAIRITGEFLKIRRAFRRGEYDLPARPAPRLIAA